VGRVHSLRRGRLRGTAGGRSAYATKAIPDRPLMILVGSVIVLLSIRGLVRALGQ
jgi:hypothetical protein